MLDKSDLQAIRGVIQETVPGIVHEIVGQVLEDIVLPRFEGIEGKVEGLDARMGSLDARMVNIETRMDRLETKTDRIEATMVTKDYLEDRLADFKSTIKAGGGQALRQIKKMATELHRNGGLSAEQAVQITSA